MASTAATCSPSSLQLRLALNCRKSRTGLVWSRVRNLENRVPFLCLGGDGGRNEAAMQRGRSGISWVYADSSDDNFSGWSNTNNEENDNDSQRKTWLGGLVGMGVAGIILVTGITVAAFSISSQNNSKHKPQMEVLTTQQEESLASDMQDTKFGKDGNTRREKNGSLECESGLDEESYASPESEETPKENGLGNDTNSSELSLKNSTNSSDGIDLTDSSFNQECLLLETELVDKSTTVRNSRSNNFPESELVGDSRNVSGSEDSYNNLAMDSEEVNLDLKENPYGVTEPNISASEDILRNINDKDETHSLVVNHNSNSLVNTSHEIHSIGGNHKSNPLADSSSSSNRYTAKEEPVILDYSVNLQPNNVLESQDLLKDISFVASPSPKENFDLRITEQVLVEVTRSSVGVLTSESGSFGTGTVSASESEYILANERGTNDPNLVNRNGSETSLSGNFFSSFGVPAPVISASSYALPGKVLIPAFVDQVHGQALAALQVLKVIEADVQASDLCTRREYARWLVSASSALSRNTISKVYPAMYIQNVTELAFDDITPEDPDFISIQGLAEAGLISSKLSRRDMLSSSDEDQGPYYFFPESPLSRQDLVSWKMALEKKQLPVADRKMLHSVSGFIDVDKIHPDACPALVADLANGEQGIIALAFGYTRLFQPDKPVTKSQAAIALATGEASDIVSEEFARIEAESMAENAVAAHTALIAEVEKEINASFEKELAIEREKINLVEKMAEEARQELEMLRSERERDKISLMKERAAVDSEMEVLSKLRCELEEKLQSLMSNKVEISHDKEKISKLRKEAEHENQEIARLQYELEVERKALSMARAWAEDEAKRAREQVKALEGARDKWERQGIKIVVDSELQEQESAGVTWLDVGKKFSVEGTLNRAENLIDKLKGMAANVRGKSRDFINMLILKIELLISKMRQWVCKGCGKQVKDLRDGVFTKASRSAAKLQQVAAELSSSLKEGTKRVVDDCRGGVERFAQKFKA